jgi:hypothetical protein
MFGQSGKMFSPGFLQQIVDSDVRNKDVGLSGALFYLQDYFAHGLQGEIIFYMPPHSFKPREEYKIITEEKMMSMVFNHINVTEIWREDFRGTPQRYLISLHNLFMKSCKDVYLVIDSPVSPRFFTDHITGTKYLNISDGSTRTRAEPDLESTISECTEPETDLESTSESESEMQALRAQIRENQKKRVDIRRAGGKDYTEVDDKRAELDAELMVLDPLSPEDEIDILDPI